MALLKSLATNSSAFTPGEATIAAMMQSSSAASSYRVLTQRTRSRLGKTTYVSLFHFRGSSSIKLFTFLNTTHYSTYSDNELPSSKRRSRGPVMAAKRAAEGDQQEEGSTQGICDDFDETDLVQPPQQN